MKNKYLYTKLFWALTLLFGTSCLGFAQTERDAQNLTPHTLHGTAKSRAMGGALGAVGADPSAISINPAGLGLYTNNAISATFSLGGGNYETLWGRDFNSRVTSNKSLSGMDNFSYISGLNFSPYSENRFNFSISYNKEKNFNRTYNMFAGDMPTSISDFSSYTAYGINEDDLFSSKDGTYNPYDQPGLNWFTILSEQGGYMAKVNNSDMYESMFIYGNTNVPHNAELNVRENGSISSFDFSFGSSLNDYVYLGATLRTYSVDYNKHSKYTEIFDAENFYNSNPKYTGEAKSDDYLELNNYLNTKGTGIGLNLGVLVNLGDYGRIGLSYLTPQYIKLTDTYTASAASYSWKGGIDFNSDPYVSANSPDSYTDYTLTRPGILTASAMMMLGKYGMISYDFDYQNMGQMKMKFEDGTENANNSRIKDQYGATFSHRIGIEIKPISKLALRAGTALYSNPITNKVIRDENKNGLIRQDLGTAGTMTDFLVSKNTSKYYTGGIGYSFNKHFSVDAAYVHGKQEHMAYPYTSSAIVNGGKSSEIPSYGAKLNETSNQFVLTLNYRF